MPSSSPAGPQTAQSGPAPAPVSPSAPLELRWAQLIRAIYGRRSASSSIGAALQSCLASRLQANLDVSGSPEYVLTWKSWGLPLGGPICALRASGRPTSAKGSTGWPTCSSRDWKDTPGMAQTGVNPDGSTRSRLDQLPRVAAIAGWPTPQVAQHGSGESPEQKKARGANTGTTMMDAVAGWHTPHTPRAHDSDNSQSTYLDRQIIGDGQRGSLAAGTGKFGALNPDLCRWLLGYPAAWGSSGATAMQSVRSSRRSSSRQLKKPTSSIEDALLA